MKSLRSEPRRTHIDRRFGGAYYWNEREFQWALCSHMKRLSQSHGLGSPWTVHAEGSVPRKPKWARWGARRRADIVVIDHAEFLRWWRRERDEEPPYVAMIEVKVLWPSYGPKLYLSGIRHDLGKLRDCLIDGLTENAYLVIIDGVDRQRVPYHSREQLRRMSRRWGVNIFHWPDGDAPIENIRKSTIGLYQ